MSDFLDSATSQLNRLMAIVTQLDLKYIDLPPAPMATGFGVAFGDTEFVVAAIAGTNEASCYLTSGVLRDIVRDRLPVLEACNSRTSANPAYPCFLHDAEIGWDVLIQTSYPVQLLVDVPPFFGACLRSFSSEADRIRADFGDKGLGGAPYCWAEDDVHRLLMRAAV
jgi:hypothetical protein